MVARLTNCPVEGYAQAVVSGEIAAGKLVRLACERHLCDLVDGPKRGVCWDATAAGRVLRFAACLQLPDKDGCFVLDPWQRFILGSLFGWKGPDKLRRFRTAYVEVGKGNGKTPLAAVIGLYGLRMDGERGAQVYSAATTQEQAGLSFRDARNIAEASGALSKSLDIGQHNIAHLASGSFFRPVSSEHRGLDGKRVHIALVDELHEHPTALVVDKMRAGTKGRTQALIFEITNSGYDRTSVCFAHHEYSEQVLTGIVENDAWFAYVCQLDPCEACSAEGKTSPTDGCPDCDDWHDEAVWIKANPGLDTVLPRKYLREQVAEATGMPTKENITKRLNFCIWTEAATHAIPMDKWDACAVRFATGDHRQQWLDRLRGRECFAPLDIGAISDFTALPLLFPEDDAETVEVTLPPQSPGEGEQKIQYVRRSYTVLPFFWLPQHPRRRDPQTQAVIDQWIREGLIRVTPGDTVDHTQVLKDMVELSEIYSFRKIAIDTGFQGMWIGGALVSHFGDDMVVSFRQGILSMAGPFRELLELIKQGRLHHDGNKVMRWMASNTAAEERGGLSKPSKDHSRDKIDGITALTMGLGVASANVVEDRWYKPGILSN